MPFHDCAAKMTAGYIAGSLVGSFAIAYLCDTFVSDKKAFGGDCPLTEMPVLNLLSVSKAALFFL